MITYHVNAMGERLVLLSDPSGEFPNNTNVSFKVRLPETKELRGTGWEAALFALSIPDGGHLNSVVTLDASLTAMYSKVSYIKFARPTTSGPFTSAALQTLDNISVAISDAWPNTDTIHISHGVDFWKRLWQKLNQRELGAFRDETTDDYANKLKNVRFLPKSHMTHIKWEGDDFIVDSVDCNRPFFEKDVMTYSPGEFAIAEWLAKQWGFLIDEHTLGPNVTWEPCSYPITTTWPPVRVNGVDRENRNVWRGPAYEYGEELRPDVASNRGNPRLWYVESGWLKMSRTVKWRFTGLKRTFEKVVGPHADDIMVYSDMVDTSIVGNQRHQLLREVSVTRTGAGRATVEPYHRQWQPIRRSHLDVIEIALGLPNGQLVPLSPGPTIVTIGIRKRGAK